MKKIDFLTRMRTTVRVQIKQYGRVRECFEQTSRLTGEVRGKIGESFECRSSSIGWTTRAAVNFKTIFGHNE